MDNPVARIVPSLLTQGSTSGASRIAIKALDLGGNPVVKDFYVRVKVADSGDYDGEATNATIAAVAGSSLEVQDNGSTGDKDLTIKAAAAASASGTLTFTDVCAHNEYLNVGAIQFRLDALYGTSNALDPDQTNRETVDISSYTTAASITIDLPQQVTAGDTMTLGTKGYTFVATGLAALDGDIALGATAAATQAAVVAAVNGTDSINTAHPQVTMGAFGAAVANRATITAITPGTAANSIALAETFTHASNVFTGAATSLAGGADATAANTITALVAAINASEALSDVVTAADGAGDTLVLTAAATGTDFNDVLTTSNLANATWGGTSLSGGVGDPTGILYVDVTNGTAETFTVYVGRALFEGEGASYRTSLNVTHA